MPKAATDIYIWRDKRRGNNRKYKYHKAMLYKALTHRKFCRKVRGPSLMASKA